MIEQRLFNLALEVITVQAVHVPAEGWQLRIATRRQGESWSSDGWTVYSHLSSEELLQSIEDHIVSQL